VESCTALIEDRNGRLALWHWVELSARASSVDVAA